VITEDPIIKQGLFPSPGAHVSTTKGGGLSKAHHHKEIIAKMFKDHPVYGPAYARANQQARRVSGPTKSKAVSGVSLMDFFFKMGI